ncbi:hypothetical protein BDV3_001290 [Batrachochytrium dendrobatidis]
MVELTSQRVLKGPSKSFAPKMKPRIPGRRSETTNSTASTHSSQSQSNPAKTVTFLEPSSLVSSHQKPSPQASDTIYSSIQTTISSKLNVQSSDGLVTLSSPIRSSSKQPSPIEAPSNSTTASQPADLDVGLINPMPEYMTSQSQPADSIHSPKETDITIPSTFKPIKIVGARPTGRPSIRASRPLERHNTDINRKTPLVSQVPESCSILQLPHRDCENIQVEPSCSNSQLIEDGLHKQVGSKSTVVGNSTVGFTQDFLVQTVTHEYDNSTSSSAPVPTLAASHIQQPVASQDEPFLARSTRVVTSRAKVFVGSSRQSTSSTAGPNTHSLTLKSSPMTPLSNTPVLASDIGLLTMKQLAVNRLMIGEISKYEKARQLKVKEYKKRKRSVDIGSNVDLSTLPLNPLKSSSSDGLSSETNSLLPSNGPRLRIIDGQIRIDETSLVLTQSGQEPLEELQRVEEGPQRYVTSASFRTRKMPRKVLWSKAMTERFFDGLSYFGTDFNTIALMFPGMSRNHIKLKFVSEEVANPKRVTFAILNKRVPGDDIRSRMMGMIAKKKALNTELYLGHLKQDDTVDVKPNISAIPSQTSDQNNQNSKQDTVESEPLDHARTQIHQDAFKTVSPGLVSNKIKDSSVYALPASLANAELLRISSRPMLGSVKPRIGPNPRVRRPVQTQSHKIPPNESETAISLSTTSQAPLTDDAAILIKSAQAASAPATMVVPTKDGKTIRPSITLPHRKPSSNLKNNA